MAIVIHNLSLLVQELDEEKLTKELDACLVNAQEIDEIGNNLKIHINGKLSQHDS